MQLTAENTLPASFTPERQEELFDEIVRLYDLADEVMTIASKEGVANRTQQLELARPFVTQVVNSANTLSAFYTEVVRNGRSITPELQDTFETALQNIFHAFTEFLDGVEEKLLSRDGQ
jgi:GTP1/Obg family GTP-binding protein